MTRPLIFCLISLPSLVAGAAPGSGILGSPHDLSVSHGGDACGFCHTPHSTNPSVPLWSKSLSQTVYRIYQSSSLEAAVGQPTGASKLCLSCHDGTVALPLAPTTLAGASRSVSARTSLGTDLSDDHPISFVYSASLVARDTQLRPVASLPEPLHLDGNGELQCTTCHDPHDNQYGDFLVLPNRRASLCTSCHQLPGWVGSSHEQATASVAGLSTFETTEGMQTVAELACAACHQPHDAGGHARLLHDAREEENCLPCHDGSVARANIAAALQLPSRHGVAAYRGRHDPRETPGGAAQHVTCVDCHNPHAGFSLPAEGPVVPGALRGVSGVTAAGGPVPEARFTYEVCFKCHADNPGPVRERHPRQIVQTNTRLEFDPTSVSFHPVVAPGVNKNVPSLQPQLTVNSLIGCTDCHDSSDDSLGRGPHGSRYAPLLRRNYETSDFTSESEFAYALCYDCHRRNSILADESFPEHRRHLDARVPCAACHDAHGVAAVQGSARNHSHLINFDTSIVSADPNSGLLQFEDQGIFRGRCTLTCHDHAHSATSY